MYYTGINPLDGKPVYVAKKGRDKAKQRALMQYKNIENYDLVKEALIEANRRDLIGFGPECLIPPRPIGQGKMQNQGRKKSGQSRSGQSRYARSSSPSQVNKTKGERKRRFTR